MWFVMSALQYFFRCRFILSGRSLNVLEQYRHFTLSLLCTVLTCRSRSLFEMKTTSQDGSVQRSCLDVSALDLVGTSWLLCSRVDVWNEPRLEELVCDCVAVRELDGPDKGVLLVTEVEIDVCTAPLSWKAAPDKVTGSVMTEAIRSAVSRSRSAESRILFTRSDS